LVAFVLIAAMLQSFVDEKEVGEQGTQVNRRVQVVDQCRSDEALRHDQLHGRLCVARVAIDHSDEGMVRRSVGAEIGNGGGQRVGQPAQRLVAAAQVVARLFTGRPGVIGREALRGVRQKELVRLFDGVALRAERLERSGVLRCVRAQIQISVSPNLNSEI
jgi:hypothetical protein